MSKQGIGYRDVLELVELIKASVHFSEIRLRQGDLEIELRRQRPAGNGHAPESTTGPQVATPPLRGNGEVPVAHGNSASGSASLPAVGSVPGAPTAPAIGSVPGASAPAASSQAARAPVTPIAGAVIIRAPMVGTAYRAPEPGARPFVEVGQAVGANDQVCIVEVMKLMNSIVADVDGVVAEILFDDGAAVAIGQPLIVIAPRMAR